MQRYLWVAILLASCAKSKKEAAPSPTSSGAAPAAEPSPQSPPLPAPPPPPVVGGASQSTSGSAPGEGAVDPKELARSQASLGPSAPSEAFDPIDDESGGERRVPAPTPAPKGAPARTVSAAIGTVTLDGTKPAPAALGQAIKVRVSDVQACHAKANKPDLAGALEVTFSVLPTGALANATVASTTLKNIAVESCVIGVLQGIKLAKPLAAAETKARVTITFAAR